MNKIKPETRKFLSILISSVIFIIVFVSVFIKINISNPDKATEAGRETAVGGVAESVSEYSASSEVLQEKAPLSETQTEIITSVTEPQQSDSTSAELNEIHENDEAAASDDPMLSVISEYGFTAADLGKSEQLVLVESSGSKCRVSVYEKNDRWTLLSDCSGIVGGNGVSRNSREGDYCTPYGLYSLGFGFGTEDLSGLKVEYRKFNGNCYWVDDTESELYNQWVETDSPDWNSAEHLSDYPDAYRYALVINYNMNPVVPGAGSAIFLHCASGSYTAGCVGVPEENMLEILKWTDSSKSPLILIV